MTTTQSMVTKEDLRYELSHYATKADLAELETRLTRQIGGLETRLVRWMIGLILGSATFAGTAVYVVQTLLAGG